MTSEVLIFHPNSPIARIGSLPGDEILVRPGRRGEELVIMRTLRVPPVKLGPVLAILRQDEQREAEELRRLGP